MFIRTLFLAALFLAAPAAAEDMLVTKTENIGRTPSNLEVDRVTLKAAPAATGKVEGKLADAPKDLPKAIEALRAKLGASGIEAEGAPLVQFNSMDETTYAATIMLPLNGAPKQQDGLQLGETPAGRAVRIVHKGPYESLEDTYFELQTFMEDEGLEAQDTMIERYITNPLVTAPKDMITEVYVPLK